MEGTRHERVIIVIAAYVIGFITAFIGFGIPDIGNFAPEIATVNPAAYTASTINSTNSAKNNSAVSVALTAEGLVANVQGEEVLLSASQYNLNTKEYDYVDGVFAAIVSYELSPDGSYVYFCEQPTREDQSCKPFVYEVTSGTLYPLTQNTQRVAFPAEAHSVTWGSRGPQMIAGETVDPLPR